MSSHRFTDLMHGFEPDDAAFERDFQAAAPPRRSYVVLFTARSGSSWLTSLLSATHRLGYPSEYLNPEFIPDTARAFNTARPRRFLQMLQRQRQSPNGIFGLEARAFDVELLGTGAFTREFAGSAVFFHLWRENLVAQAVSLYRAVASGRFHSDSAAGSAEPPPYDADQIQLWLHQTLLNENANVALLQRLGAPAKHLRYEHIVADRAGTLACFARVLGETLPPSLHDIPAAEELTKLGDGWNAAAEQRYRSERAAELARAEAARIVLHGIPSDPPPPPPTAPAPHAAWQSGHVAGLSGNPPFDPPAGSPRQTAAWLAGWRAGWNDQPILPRTTELALPKPVPLPPDAPEDLFASLHQPPPQPLHDYTARRLTDLLEDQARRAVPGGLLELGLTRGRHTALLLRAPRAPHTRIVGLDLLDGALIPILRKFLATQVGDAAHAWSANRLPPNFTAAELAQLMGGPARYIAIDSTHAPTRLPEALRLADLIIHEDGCVTVSDFLQPTRLSVTEHTLAFLRTIPRLVPVALLPDRLLLAPPHSAPRYSEMLKALALRDRTSRISTRLQDAIAHNTHARLHQTLLGHTVLVIT